MLLFIDGTRESHIEWALDQGDANSKIILVRGNPVQLEQQLGRPVTFDRVGLLVSQFGIEHVPAKIYAQEGVVMVEEEVVN